MHLQPDLPGLFIDLGIQFGIINKSGAWLSYEGSKFQGRDNAKQLLEDNPELAEELEAKIFEAMKNPQDKKR